MSTTLRVVFGASLVASMALAAEPAPTPTIPTPNVAPTGVPSRLYGDGQSLVAPLGIARLDGGWFVVTRPVLEVGTKDLTLAFQAPLSLLLPFPTPSAEAKAATYGGVIRKADWPTPTVDNYGQYLQLVRWVRYGGKGATIYGEAGQLQSASIGHSTIVDRYSNALDPNLAKPGLVFDVNTKYGGFETLVDSIAVPSTNVLALRGYVKPMAFVGQDPAEESRLAVGATVAGDRRAPVLGAPDRFVAWGVDVEYRVFDNAVISIIPYADYVQLESGAASAAGVHVGSRAEVKLGDAVNLWAKLEYRLVGSGYIPAYFDAAYDLQRSQYLDTPGSSKADAFRAGDFAHTAFAHGVLGEAVFAVKDLLTGGASFQAIPAIANSSNLTVFATIPTFETVKLSGYYLRKNFDAASELVAFDERTVVTGAISYHLAGPFWATANVNRHWQRDEAGTGFVPVTDFQLGVDGRFELGDRK